MNISPQPAENLVTNLEMALHAGLFPDTSECIQNVILLGKPACHFLRGFGIETQRRRDSRDGARYTTPSLASGLLFRQAELLGGKEIVGL